MNSALESSLSTNPLVKGILYADNNGLCMSGILLVHGFSIFNLGNFTAVGEINPQMCGRYSSITRTAGSLHSDMPSPIILIETRDSHILVKEYDENTVVLNCAPSED